MDTVILCLAALFLLCWVIVLKLNVAEKDATIAKIKQELARETQILTHQVDVNVSGGSRSGSASDFHERHPTHIVRQPSS